jgi:hypothetical protein
VCSRCSQSSSRYCIRVVEDCFSTDGTQTSAGPRLNIYVTPWNTGLEQLNVVELVNKFPPFMETEGSVPCSQGPATGPYPDPD